MELVVKRTTKYSAFCKEQARGMFEFICCGCDGAVLGWEMGHVGLKYCTFCVLQFSGKFIIKKT